MTAKILTIQGTVEDLVKELSRLSGGASGDEDLLGLDRRPGEGGPAPEKPRARRSRILLTLRRDLVSMREKLLNGAGRKALLGELDYTIDQLDNMLAEM